MTVKAKAKKYKKNNKLIKKTLINNKILTN